MYWKESAEQSPINLLPCSGTPVPCIKPGHKLSKVGGKMGFLTAVVQIQKVQSFRVGGGVKPKKGLSSSGLFRYRNPV